ncbi:hypothetical protein J2Z40_003036 [Cytobacillus eiseniae]|uniref:DUF4179 domain-containing protein n=1 Tax=Cytobacillus eiseniae TaxID=762947 RepID=A0ABS4RKX9_9BACI|nr:DUF4179 domain-containing protein [Cytobacillus eiseniae]MBP2242462.1 hypothetical protein [Cytobacillus eiseniae]
MLDFTREEEELEKTKTAYSQLTISDEQSNHAILEGIKRANGMKAKRKRLLPVKILLSASILMLVFISSVKISDTVAAYAMNIPGLEKVVELIRNDKGLLAAMENDHIQKVNLSDEHEGFKVTIDSVIHDESNLIVFFKYSSKDEKFGLKEIYLMDQDGKSLPFKINKGSYSDKGALSEVRFSLAEDNVLPDKLIISFEMGLNSGKVFEDKWNIPITLDKEKLASKQVYTLNQKIEVEDQKLTVKKVVSYPTHTAIHVEYDPKNSKKIFGIEGLRLEDGKGESWNSNKVDDTWISENERIIYLESHYFSAPKKLYLRFDSIRALEKDELWVEIDPKTNQILKAPKDELLKKVERGSNRLAIQLEANRDFMDHQIILYASDSAGNKIDHKGYVGATLDGHSIWYTVPFPTNENISGPIKLELLDYPAEIRQDIKIKIK